jgi:dethiobiotin synthetase
MRPHPLQAFRRAVSTHLAARDEGRDFAIPGVVSQIALHATTIHGWQVVETAGGVFSPLSSRTTNFDLAFALEPAVWILVAPDALGVLHDVRATLTAMEFRGRVPDQLVLSAARDADTSAGTNAAELPRVGLPAPIAVLGRASGSNALARLVRQLVRSLPR